MQILVPHVVGELSSDQHPFLAHLQGVHQIEGRHAS